MSRIHLLDTNVHRAWADARHSRHSATLSNVEQLGDDFVFLSVITVAEVESGLARPHKLEIEEIQAIRRGLSRFPVMAIDRHVAEPYGQLRAWLVQRYGPPAGRRKIRSLSELADPATDISLGIQENDLWLASQAISTSSVLVTADKLTRLREAATGTKLELLLASW